jgi:monofunctional biosynthetic peptidoglycan transglycosylase
LIQRVVANGRRILWLGAYLLAAYLAAVLVLVGVYRFVDPPMSLLMLSQGLAGTKITQRWVPLAGISPNLMRAVVVSEDGRFCVHRGVDLGEMKAAIERARDGIPRGASTLTMQVAKNLFLSPFNAYLRKVVEIPLAMVIEVAWPKWRIFEIYANIAEWGPGIFGAEAAARHHFRKPASKLSESEAALLAVSLPNPIDRDAGSPGPGIMRLAQRIQLRMRSMTRATACLESAPGVRSRQVSKEQ